MSQQHVYVRAMDRLPFDSQQQEKQLSRVRPSVSSWTKIYSSHAYNIQAEVSPKNALWGRFVMKINFYHESADFSLFFFTRRFE